ncbi:MAG: PilX N-terminal domain-containing pilus assembly protein [Stagnimonas sp.]|nr:PilX N-terminal domain-containing pilus assembly protein [Stagnimonas sp.]
MSRHLDSPRSERGAALAVALILLVVLTLLGVAAVRSTQTELRLAQNAESRASARQLAESMISVILAEPANIPVNENPNYRSCFLPSEATPPAAQFTCTGGNRDLEIQLRRAGQSDASDLNTVPDWVLRFGYAETSRQLPLFVSVDVMREAQTSARGYDFARYSVTAGFDRTAEGRSAAEVTESRLVLHTKVAGVNYE